MEDKLFITSLVVFSSFSMIYGNLLVDAIGKANVKCVQQNPVIMYLTIYFYVVFIITTVYKERIRDHIMEILLLSILLFAIVIFVITAHPILAISTIFGILCIYIYLIQKPKHVVADYI